MNPHAGSRKVAHAPRQHLAIAGSVEESVVVTHRSERGHRVASLDRLENGQMRFNLPRVGRAEIGWERGVDDDALQGAQEDLEAGEVHRLDEHEWKRRCAASAFAQSAACSAEQRSA